MERLNDPSASSFLIGAFLNDPQLTTSGKYPINISKNENWDDFYERWMIVLYAVIKNLAEQEVSVIDCITVSKFLEPFPTQKAVLDDVNVFEKIDTLKEASKAETINLYYNIVKKYSILRYYRDKGYNISKFYDENGDEITEREKLTHFTIDDIVNHYEGLNIDARKKFISSISEKEMWGGEGWDNVLDALEETPMVGATLTSPMVNSVFRGWVKGHLILLGSASGKGKTTNAIASLCNVCCTKLWNNETGKYEVNPYREGKGAYIHTEQDTEKEIQPRFIATISKIPYHKILDGNYTKEEKARLSDAGKIMLESGIKLINLPDFTINKLDYVIKDVATNDCVQYVVFDYLWNNFSAGAELKAQSGTPIREDMVMLQLADCCKKNAEKNHVGVMTMVQLNGNEKVNEVIDEACLYGSKQMKTKLDCGYILLPPRKKEKNQAEEVLIPYYNSKHSQRNGFNMGLKIDDINTIFHVFKGRYSKYGTNVKIWGYLDYATGEFIDYFATDLENKFINIEPIVSVLK